MRRGSCLRQWLAALPAGVMAVGLALFFCGCEDDDHDDHVPPAGQGSLIVVNRTVDDLDVFAGGTLLGRVKDGSEGVTDLAPGTYRIVLDEADGSRNWRDDVEVLQNRLTILRVYSGGVYTYSVSIEFK